VAGAAGRGTGVAGLTDVACRDRLSCRLQILFLDGFQDRGHIMKSVLKVAGHGLSISSVHARAAIN
jgi:hypothetical protein